VSILSAILNLVGLFSEIGWLQQVFGIGVKIEHWKKEDSKDGIEGDLLKLWRRSSSNVCWSCSQLLEQAPIAYDFPLNHN
jgi:hypothetical protein